LPLYVGGKQLKITTKPNEILFLTSFIPDLFFF